MDQNYEPFLRFADHVTCFEGIYDYVINISMSEKLIKPGSLSLKSISLVLFHHSTSPSKTSQLKDVCRDLIYDFGA
jgi:hypothetical protein